MACLTPFYLDVVDKVSGLPSRVLVPCGHCEGCLKKKQSDWIARLLVESQLCFSSFFITLTYDENHLPFPEGVNKKDVQLFWKTFRKYNEFGIFKYFLISEYGGITSRPHYHFLLFFRDNKVDWILLSRLLERCWKNGQHKIGTVDIASISYTTKYCLKARKDPRHLYKNQTFGMYSKRPAIGFDLLELAPKFVERNCFEVVSGNMVVAMPRYYRDKIFDDLQKYEHQQEMQRLYSSRPSAISANDRYLRRLQFERKQSRM